MEPSDLARAAVAELTRTWGSKPKVFRHADEAERHFLFVASCADSPVPGVTAVGTAGLSDHDLGHGNLRVELIGAFPATFDEGSNIAATCAFNAFKDGVPAVPDAIHPNVVRLYAPDAELPHILLTDPFLWEAGPNTVTCGGQQIAWLMMVPISESERAFAEDRSVAELTSLFEQSQIDIFDLHRAAVV